MTSEVKHFYYNSTLNADGVRLGEYNEKLQSKGLKYIPKGLPQYKIAEEGDDTINYSVNFLKVFDPETIFPKNQGVTSVQQLVGNKFKWLNTMLDIEIQSNGILSLYNIATDANVSAITPSTSTSSTGQTANTTVGPSTLSVDAISGRLLTVTGSGVGTAVTVTPGAVTTSLPVNQVTQVAPYEEWTNKQSFRVVNSQGQPVTGYYSTTSMPLLMSPAFKPYYYCRFVVIRMNISFTDYINYMSKTDLWSDFFNGLWWRRSHENSSDGFIDLPHMSQRVNDYNVTNPFGGMFDMVYNKKLKVNPLKVFRMRYNLKSRRRGGDLITIRTDNPLNPVPSGQWNMYNNGTYFGFLLSPLSLGDFDPITQQYILSQSPYTPDYVNVNGNPQTQAFRRSVLSADNQHWTAPDIELGNQSYGTVLNCANVSIYGRTAYLD